MQDIFLSLLITVQIFFNSFVPSYQNSDKQFVEVGSKVSTRSFAVESRSDSSRVGSSQRAFEEAPRQICKRLAGARVFIQPLVSLHFLEHPRRHYRLLRPVPSFDFFPPVSSFFIDHSSRHATTFLSWEFPIRSSTILFQFVRQTVQRSRFLEFICLISSSSLSLFFLFYLISFLSLLSNLQPV